MNFKITAHSESIFNVKQLFGSNNLRNSFHSVVCLTTGPKPLPKPAPHTVRSRASSFKWDYPLLSLRSSSSVLRLLPHLPVTSIPSFIFPSITRCRRQFLRKMWPIQLAFRLLFHVGYPSAPWLYVIILHFSFEIPVIKYKVLSQTYKVTKYTFTGA